jgi:hypothetical protein
MLAFRLVLFATREIAETAPLFLLVHRRAKARCSRVEFSESTGFNPARAESRISSRRRA